VPPPARLPLAARGSASNVLLQAPQTLSIVACLEMYNAVSCMSVDSWMQHGSAFESTLLNAGRLLCGLRRCDSLQQYLQKLSGGGGSGSSGPCTCVWTTGTIAYRCGTLVQIWRGAGRGVVLR
jgi:hypothetical protein